MFTSPCFLHIFLIPEIRFKQFTLTSILENQYISFCLRFDFREEERMFEDSCCLDVLQSSVSQLGKINSGSMLNSVLSIQQLATVVTISCVVQSLSPFHLIPLHIPPHLV